MPVWLLLAVLSCGGDANDGPSTAPEPIEPDPVTTEAAPAPLAAPTEPKYGATHILIAYQGAVRAPSTVTRSEAEAATQAAALRERALEGEALEELARAHSDGPSAPRGGQLGVYLTGTMVPDFEAAVASVDVGAIGPVVHTPFGWHVVRRDAVVEVRVSHLLVTWDGAWRSGVKRSQEEARARIEEALTKLEGGDAFADVARAYSDDSTADTGGELGVIAPGQMIPAFEEAAFALEIGERSGLVETPYGYHVITRTE